MPKISSITLLRDFSKNKKTNNLRDSNLKPANRSGEFHELHRSVHLVPVILNTIRNLAQMIDGTNKRLEKIESNLSRVGLRVFELQAIANELLVAHIIDKSKSAFALVKPHSELIGHLGVEANDFDEVRDKVVFHFEVLVN